MFGKKSTFAEKLMQETKWERITFVDGDYEISNIGLFKYLDFYSREEELITPGTETSDGHLGVTLKVDGKYKWYGIHRLVALLFVPIPEKYKGIPVEKLEVHHKDFNPFNNNADNLEWLTHREHMALHKAKRVGQFTTDKKLVRIWNSLAEIEEETGYSKANICNCCNKKPRFHTAYKFIWRYV